MLANRMVASSYRSAIRSLPRILLRSFAVARSSAIDRSYSNCFRCWPNPTAVETSSLRLDPDMRNMLLCDVQPEVQDPMPCAMNSRPSEDYTNRARQKHRPLQHEASEWPYFRGFAIRYVLPTTVGRMAMPLRGFEWRYTRPLYFTRQWQ